MTSPYDLYATSNTAETEGVRLDFGDFYMVVARAGGANKRFQQVLEAKRRPHARQIEAGTLDPDLAERLLAEAYAETIVKEWGSKQHGKGKVPGRDGAPMEFTPENVVTLLTDLPDLFMDVRVEANRLANFRARQIEEAEKN